MSWESSHLGSDYWSWGICGPSQELLWSGWEERGSGVMWVWGPVEFIRFIPDATGCNFSALKASMLVFAHH